MSWQRTNNESHRCQMEWPCGLEHSKERKVSVICEEATVKEKGQCWLGEGHEQRARPRVKEERADQMGIYTFFLNRLEAHGEF